MQIWIVFTISAFHNMSPIKPMSSERWDFIGVFETEEQALEVCNTRNHFIGPAELNKDYTDATEWTRGYFPKR